MAPKIQAFSCKDEATGEEYIARLQALFHQNERLALMGRVAASKMHEINNPAEAIANLVYLISQRANDPGMVKSLAAQIEEQLVRIQYVTRQTLTFFRDRPDKENTDLVALIGTAVRFQELLLRGKKIEIRQEMPERHIAKVYPGDFLQLVSNLLSNAMEAVTVGGCLWIRLRADGARFRLTVSDNGGGIPESIRRRLFEPFQTSKGERGNGLGLWICKSVVEKHGGRLSWRSSTRQKTHGTTFSVSMDS